jgi:hypothetical protein
MRSSNIGMNNALQELKYEPRYHHKLRIQFTERTTCFTLNSTNIRYENLNIKKKNKIMAFVGTEPIRSKIVIDNMILEQVNTFTCLGCNISYREEKDIHSNITKFLQILGLG